MAIKDILVCLDASEAGECRLRLAAGLAREHGAHLAAAYLFFEPGTDNHRSVPRGLGERH
jgi:hypothetical protein